MAEYPEKATTYWDVVDSSLDEVRKTKRTAAEREMYVYHPV
jgi:hypothetical protein